MKWNEDQLNELLQRIKKEKTVTTRDLKGEEIPLAEELVSRGLLSKVSTRTTTAYCYEG